MMEHISTVQNYMEGLKITVGNARDGVDELASISRDHEVFFAETVDASVSRPRPPAHRSALTLHDSSGGSRLPIKHTDRHQSGYCDGRDPCLRLARRAVRI